jgi:Tfp pilus assembly protein FimT
VIELVFALGIGLVLTAMALPMVQSTLANFKLQGSVSSLTGAVQATRYQAIQNGFPFKLTLTASTLQYQVANEPSGTSSFSSVGSAVPFASNGVTLNADTTLYFSPRGVIGTSAGAATCPTAATMTLTYSGLSKTITVSCYGQITTS